MRKRQLETACGWLTRQLKSDKKDTSTELRRKGGIPCKCPSLSLNGMLTTRTEMACALGAVESTAHTAFAADEVYLLLYPVPLCIASNYSHLKN